MKILLWLLLFFGRLVVSSVPTVGFLRTFGFRLILVGFFSCKSRRTHLTTLWYFSCLHFLKPNVGRKHSLLSSLNLTDTPILAHLSSLPVLSSTLVDCKLQRVRPCLPPCLFNPSCTKPFGTHTLYQVGSAAPLIFKKPHLL